MLKMAKAMTEEEIEASAKYFVQQKLRRRVCVIESLRIRGPRRAALDYEEVGGTEDLEARMLEVTDELPRHERRDDRLEDMAGVPPGKHHSRQTPRPRPPGSDPARQDGGLRHLPRPQTHGHRQGSAHCRAPAYLPAAAAPGLPQRHAHGRSRGAVEPWSTSSTLRR